MDEKEINSKYRLLHQALEDESFVIVNQGTLTQHRELKEGKTRAEFDARHSELHLLWSAELSEPKPPLVFTSPPGTGMPEKVEYIEQFLKKLYGQ